MKTLLTLTGPSCGGKTTLETELKKHGFVATISTTTRPKRDGEKHLESYYFVTELQFLDIAKNGGFIESASFNGNKYGTEAEELTRVMHSGKPVVLVVEPYGLEQIHLWGQKNPDVKIVSLFIDCPADVVAERFMARFIADFSLSISKGSKEMEKVVQTYKNRLGCMMAEEKLWRGKCQRWVERNIDYLNADNMESTVDMIKRLTCDPLERADL